FSEVAQSVRVYPNQFAVRNDKIIESETVTLVDEPFFEVFSFPLIKGDPSSVLTGLKSVVLTEIWAKKYFGDEDPIGKTLTISYGKFSDAFTVTGIAESPPDNSTIKFNILINFNSLKLFGKEDRLVRWSGWSDSMKGYILVSERGAVSGIKNRYPDFSRQYYARIQRFFRTQAFKEDVDPVTFGLQKFTDVHMDPRMTGSNDIILMYALPGGIAVIILIISSINFITLSIGNANKRISEIGVRKVLGAQRKQLIRQFTSESIVLTGFAVIFGLFFVILFLPVFNEIARKSINIKDLFSFSNILLTLFLGTSIGLVVGSYSGILLSGLKPVEIFRGKFKLSGKNTFTRILVTSQFALSVFLIISTLILSKQIGYLVNSDLNYNKDGIVLIETLTSDADESTNILNQYRERLRNQNNIINVSAAYSGLTNWRKTDIVNRDGVNYDLDVIRIDYDFFNTLGIEIIEGRDFSREHITDLWSAVVNKTFVEKLGFDNPVGKLFDYDGVAFTIIGVIKDVPIVARVNEMAPEIYYLFPNLALQNIFVKISPHNIIDTIKLLGSTWRGLFPDKPFNYSFLDENLKAQYVDGIRFQNIFIYSSAVAIIIACFGVLGLTSVAINRRTKEIAIRKINGAPILSVMKLLSSESVKWVILGNIIACPFAWYFWQNFLQMYTHRITISPFLFFFTAFFTLFLVLAVTFFHILRAAKTNPVDSLRYE
ncbi:ABC transporter permease, partial [candidate division KSB1 bacterium]